MTTFRFVTFIVLAPIILIDRSCHGGELATTTVAQDQETTTISNWQKIKQGVKGLWHDFITEHFVKKYKKLEDLYANTKKDLTQKVDDTADYVSAVAKRQKELIKAVGNETKESAKRVLKKLNDWTDDLAKFKNQLQQSAKEEYTNLTAKWKKSISKKWNGGLEKIVEISRKLETSNAEGINQPILIENIESAMNNETVSTDQPANSKKSSTNHTDKGQSSAPKNTATTAAGAAQKSRNEDKKNNNDVAKADQKNKKNSTLVVE